MVSVAQDDLNSQRTGDKFICKGMSNLTEKDLDDWMESLWDKPYNPVKVIRDTPETRALIKVMQEAQGLSDEEFTLEKLFELLQKHDPRK